MVLKIVNESMNIKNAIWIILFVPYIACSQTESKPNWSGLYNCEGCEAIYEGTATSSSIQIAPKGEPGEPLNISGIVYESDGRTPAKDIILYVYHTNHKGIYPTRGNEKGWGKRHGYLRGWLITNEKGQYEINTIKPAQYPSRTDAAHIHVTVKEPNRKEYWIDEIVFSDDPLVNDTYRQEQFNRGGSGIVTLRKIQNTWTGTHNIILAPPDSK
ncbi:MAG: intradiol ring-cleavage dioxygenase [Flammeovirgaceae bacterium]|nr:intradiol ring-cleavage dioxygenase [Flammeovirgaceae bacterium]